MKKTLYTIQQLRNAKRIGYADLLALYSNQLEKKHEKTKKIVTTQI